MIEPRLAVVRPRAISPNSGEVLPLEAIVGDCLTRRDWKAIQVVGGSGCGKTTALQHLAAVLPPMAALLYLDDADELEVAAAASVRRVVCAGPTILSSAVQIVLPLVPWSEDELIEFLQGKASSRVADVVPRLHAASAEASGATPAVWECVLDELLSDPNLPDVPAALERAVERVLVTAQHRRLAAEYCLATLLGDDEGSCRALGLLAQDALGRAGLPLLQMPSVQRSLAAKQIKRWLENGGECPAFDHRLPEGLVRELARHVQSFPAFQRVLESILVGGRRAWHPQSASVLYEANRYWRPPDCCRANLGHGSFRNATWPAIRLTVTSTGRCELPGIDLSGANLQGAVFDGALLINAQLAGARLDKSSLVGLDARSADFAGASLVTATLDCSDLRNTNFTRAKCDEATFIGVRFDGATLSQASFRNVNLAYSDFRDCSVEEADFTNSDLQGCILRKLPLRLAILQGAIFRRADLTGVDLEGVHLPGADFRESLLCGALLTGSAIPDGEFAGANLRGAGLADIDWENADLRGADLEECSFHMGSSRSGLVGSPYPMHGSKTGFYTDDYFALDYKTPEEIRKANLRGADLRGANLTGVDFYLVDLRDAKIDEAYFAYVQASGAILGEPCL